MVKGLTIRSGQDLSEAALRAAAEGCTHVDLYAYIGHKIGMSVPEIKEESEERFLVIEAEAVRDIVIMNAMQGGDVLLTFPPSTLDNPECARLLTEGL